MNKTINFFFGLNHTFCYKPFSFFHYLNILSAKRQNPDYTINLYYGFKPETHLFDLLDSVCNKIQITNIPTEIAGKNFAYAEHVGDLLRIQKLYEEGGIYLDIDVVCVRSFDALTDYECVLGEEYGAYLEDGSEKYIGLCNATILAKKQSKFLKAWIESYFLDYRKDWNYNSVIKPDQIAKLMPECIQIEPKTSFFKFSWDRFGYESLFLRKESIDDCYSLHLWESRNFPTLEQYDENISNEIWRQKCTLTEIYKQLI